MPSSGGLHGYYFSRRLNLFPNEIHHSSGGVAFYRPAYTWDELSLQYMQEVNSPCSTLLHLLLHFLHDMGACVRVITHFLFNTGRVIHRSLLKATDFKLQALPHTPLRGQRCCAEGSPSHRHTASCFAASWSASSLWYFHRHVSFTCNNILVRESINIPYI